QNRRGHSASLARRLSPCQGNGWLDPVGPAGPGAPAWARPATGRAQTGSKAGKERGRVGPFGRRRARCSSRLVAAAAVVAAFLSAALAPVAAGADDEVVIEGTGLHPPLVRTTTSRRVPF